MEDTDGAKDCRLTPSLVLSTARHLRSDPENERNLSLSQIIYKVHNEGRESLYVLPWLFPWKIALCFHPGFSASVSLLSQQNYPVSGSVNHSCPSLCLFHSKSLPPGITVYLFCMHPDNTFLKVLPNEVSSHSCHELCFEHS